MVCSPTTGVVSQFPLVAEFQPNEKWPQEITPLYTDASKCYAAGAFTACAMMCRKILMSVACKEGDAEGKTFAQYVDYITGTVLQFQKAKPAIDRIRNIGNEANHQVALVIQDDARTAMRIVTYMLNTIYSLPST